MLKKLRDWLAQSEPRVGDQVYCARFGVGTLTKVMPAGWPTMAPIKVGYVEFDNGMDCEVPMVELTLYTGEPQ
jgi:hypothetical protein